MKLKRTEFINRLVRLLLISVLAFIAVALGNRVVSGQNCSGCPGRGICRGDQDCGNY